MAARKRKVRDARKGHHPVERTSSPPPSTEETPVDQGGGGAPAPEEGAASWRDEPVEPAASEAHVPAQDVPAEPPTDGTGATDAPVDEPQVAGDEEAQGTDVVRDEGVAPPPPTGIVPERPPLAPDSVVEKGDDPEKTKRERKPKDEGSAKPRKHLSPEERRRIAEEFGTYIDAGLDEAAAVFGSELKASLVELPYDIDFSDEKRGLRFEERLVKASVGFGVAYNLASTGKAAEDAIIAKLKEHEDTIRGVAALGIVIMFGIAVYQDVKERREKQARGAGIEVKPSQPAK